jgi:hypothetical protein
MPWPSRHGAGWASVAETLDSETTTCRCKKYNCQSSVLYGPVGSSQVRVAGTPHSSNGASLIAVMSAPYLFTNVARPWGTRTASARNASANAFLNPTRG